MTAGPTSSKITVDTTTTGTMRSAIPGNRSRASRRPRGRWCGAAGSRGRAVRTRSGRPDRTTRRPGRRRPRGTASRCARSRGTDARGVRPCWTTAPATIAASRKETSSHTPGPAVRNTSARASNSVGRPGWRRPVRVAAGTPTTTPRRIPPPTSRTASHRIPPAAPVPVTIEAAGPLEVAADEEAHHDEGHVGDDRLPRLAAAGSTTRTAGPATTPMSSRIVTCGSRQR